MANSSPTPLRVLMVSYYYPPVGGVPVQRFIKFVKYLPRFGITPIVLTTATPMGLVKDHELLGHNSLYETRTIRLGGEFLQEYNEKRALGTRPAFSRYLHALRGLPLLDAHSAWYSSIRKRLPEIVERERIDLVFTTSPPHSTHLVGFKISKLTGLPWIMDLRDSMSWSPASRKNFSDWLQRFVESIYEKRFVKQASRVLTVSAPMKENMTMRVGRLVSNKILVIENGFDPDDSPLRTSPHVGSEQMLILYTGSLHRKQTPAPFLNALRALAAQGLIDPSKIRIRFMGRIDSRAQQIIDDSTSVLQIETIGPISHSKCVASQQAADLLLLLMTSDAQGVGAEVLTGKVFEYMAATRPIFAVAVRGALWDLIESGPFGVCADFRDQAVIEEAFLSVYRQWCDKRVLPYAPNTGVLSKYSRIAQTKRLSKVFREVALTNGGRTGIISGR